jgi:hypothetical protein
MSMDMPKKQTHNWDILARHSKFKLHSSDVHGQLMDVHGHA